MKGDVPLKYFKVVIIFVFIFLLVQERALASGPFGPPQPIARDGGGMHTAIGYWLQEDKYKGNTEYITRQHQMYSELGYGFKNYGEIYGRLGLAGLKVFDAFSSSTATTTTSKNDFEENWKFFTTLGAKGFYPISKTFGIGAFIQGTYYFSDFTDNVSGTRNGAPFTVEIGVKDWWDVNAGIGLQATIPYGIKLYAGPYAYYSEAKVSPTGSVTGLELTSGGTIFRNKTNIGGFAGFEVPLAKGFRLNLEGKYSDRWSAGVAVSYVY